MKTSLHRHATVLRKEAYDAIAVLEVGLSGATDERVPRLAVDDGRARDVGRRFRERDAIPALGKRLVLFG
jgi:hypothetical protein